MGITVGEALQLESLGKAVILAGKKGLDREIERVSVIECPESIELFRKGDFYLTAFFSLKNDVQGQLEMLQALEKSGSSGLCVIDLYFDDLDEEIKKYANTASYPILILPNYVYYSDIISEVNNALLQDKEDMVNELCVDSIMQAKDPKEINRLAQKINVNFKDRVVVMYLADEKRRTGWRWKSMFKNELEDYPHYSILGYRKGALLLLTFERQEDDASIEERLLRWEEIIKNKNPSIKVGIGSFKHSIYQLDMAIKEALLAMEVCKNIEDSCTIYYEELGTFKLLAPFRGEPELEQFYQEIIGPLRRYDEEQGTELLETVIAFVERDGVISKTAEALSQHENTIRYRLKKVQEVLNMEDLNFSFYEQLFAAVKIHKIMG